ncbi:MAG: hypothetical protein E6J42_07185 [Chloroflexi bacterium]|nr:MAG: hypothetical protein E6J42_07185 [Chloroflexota bacterium]
MPTLLRAARLLTPSEEMRPGSLLMERDKIVALGADVAVPEAAIVDLGDATLVPGFVDIHVHGGGGFSLSTDNGREIESYGLRRRKRCAT